MIFRAGFLRMCVFSAALLAGMADAQSAWTRREVLPPLPVGMRAVTWTGTQFVAVGPDIAATSPDGTTWITRKVGTECILTAVTWTGSQLVAVGYVDAVSGPQRGVILTSPDGISWTARNSGATAPLNAVAWTGSKVVAAGNELFTSSDAVNWTKHESSGVFMFLLVNGSSLMAARSDGIWTSSDGVVWVQKNATPNVSPLSLAFNGTLFAAVTGESQADRTAIWTSGDGVVWTKRFSTKEFPLSSIAWDGTKFLAAGLANILQSPDGVSWTEGAGANMAGTTVFAATPNHWILLRGAGIATSTDGMAWTMRTPPANANDLYGVIRGNNRLVAVGGSILTSMDGTSWQVPVFAATPLYAVAWTGTKYVAVGEGGLVRASSDGISWDSGSTGTATLRAVTWTGTQLVAGGDGGVIATSPDGKVWTTRVSGVTGPISSVTWMGDRLVAAAGGVILFSTNGTTWLMDTVSINWVRSVAYFGGTYIAVGSLYGFQSSHDIAPYDVSRVLVSSNGSDWTSSGGPTIYFIGWKALASSGPAIVVVGDAGNVLTFDDAAGWIPRGSIGKEELTSVIWTGNQFVAVGKSGAVFTTADPTALRASAHKDKGLSLRLKGSRLFITLPSSMIAGQARVSLYNLSGIKVGRLNNPGSGEEIALPVAGFAPGIYYVSVTGSGKRFFQPVCLP